MPASILVELVLQGFLELAFYFLGRIVVPVVSFGNWKCDSLTPNTPWRKIRAAGLYHLRGQQVHLTPEATQVVGFLAFLLLLGAGSLIWYVGSTGKVSYL